MMSRPWLLLAAMLSTAWPAGAQTVPRRFSDPAPSPGVFTGAVMHMAIEPLSSGDISFKWNAEFGGNVDVVDYGLGRVNVLAHYQAVLGREFQRFDPNQGIYTLEALASFKQGRGEWWAGVRHLSRHFGDRPKDFHVYYHSLAGRYATSRDVRGWRANLHGGGGWVVSRRYLDYRATLDGEIQVVRLGAGRAQPFGRIATEKVWVVPSATRTARLGWRMEAGVRVTNSRARGELYLGAEQRYDADILAPTARRWLVAGLRVSSP